MSDLEDFLPFAVPDIGDREIHAAAEAMRSGWLTTGPNVAAFEREFAGMLGDGVQAVALNSATAGLHLALEAIGIGPGDQVLVPTWTFTASAEVVRYLGADPVLVDVDPLTLNIDFDAAADALTPHTRAIIPVHFAGLAISGKTIARFAEQHGLSVVEDAAHALPSTADGCLVGSGSSDATVFSFYATKTMTTGEGGMLVTRRADVAQRARTMRLHGISRDVFDRYRSTTPAWHYEVVAPGYKYNLTDPAAAMGRVQLSRLTEMRDARARIAGRYLTELADCPVVMPSTAEGPGDHAWHLFVIRIGLDAPVDRDTFIENMAAGGVGCSVHFIPLHRQPYWRERYDLDRAAFPQAESAYGQAVSLPLFSGMTDRQIDRVIETVRKVLQR